MMRRIALVCVAILAGCAVGPDYRRPELDVPKAFRYEPQEVKDIINTAWWAQFQDPVLDRLIADALAGNKSIKIAAANVEQAEAVLMQVRAPLFPQFGYSGSGTRERPSGNLYTSIPGIRPEPRTTYQAFGTASWELDLWGRIRRQTEAANANVLATSEARRGVILSLVGQVAKNYLLLRGLDEQLSISQRSLATYGESVRLFELQFKYGQVSEMTVAQARTQYETADAAIPQIQAQIIQTENAISILLGRNPGPIPRGKSIYELTAPAVPAGLPSELLSQRPDVLQAEQNLIAQNALIGAARALYFPNLSLTGAWGGASEELRHLFKDPSRAWTFTGTVQGPLFTFGAIYGQVKQASAAQKAALESYEAAVQSAFADVENALSSREKLSEQLSAQTRLLAASKTYERLATLQYNGGYAPYSTVLQAQQQLFPAELQWAQLSSSTLGAAVTVYQAMGGGWVDAADGMTATALAGRDNATGQSAGDVKK
jgi:outer membrane protein, multidrug efflux system